MNFLHLLYFVTVAKEGSMRQAAEKLYVSQQAISNHIAKLENELDVELFDRRPVLQLTYAGRCLFNASTQILDIKEKVLSDIEEIKGGNKGCLKVGVAYSRVRFVIPSVLKPLREEFPDVSISLHEANNTTELEKWLLHREIDIFLGIKPIISHDISYLHLAKERIYVLVPKSVTDQVYGENAEYIREKSMNEGINILDFTEQNFALPSLPNRVRMTFDLFMANCGYIPRLVFESKNSETLLSCVINGMGLTIYSEHLLRAHLQNYPESVVRYIDAFPINNPDFCNELVVGYSPSHRLTRVEKRFIELFRDEIRD